MTKKLYLYITKKFLWTFVLVVISIALLIAAVNIFILLGEASNKQINFLQIILLDVLQIPGFLADISIFLIMLSVMITLFSLSIRSEITVMRASGVSLLQITLPIILTVFGIGVFYILVFNPLSIVAAKKFNQMNNVLIEGERIDLFSPIGGIWLKQSNVLQDNQEIIIRAQRIYRQDLKMEEVSLWFFNQDHQFYKRIDAKSMVLQDQHWYIQNALLNDQSSINKHIKELQIPTNLKADFVTKKILNNFEEVRFSSVYELPTLINDLKSSGFSPRKFLVQYYSILSKPFLFVAISLIAVFFAVNNVRSKNNILLFIAGVIVGLILYIIPMVINAFASSGLIPVFLSTWIITLILVAIGILVIFKKDKSY